MKTKKSQQSQQNFICKILSLISSNTVETSSIPKFRILITYKF